MIQLTENTKTAEGLNQAGSAEESNIMIRGVLDQMQRKQEEDRLSRQ